MDKLGQPKVNRPCGNTDGDGDTNVCDHFERESRVIHA